ncbi:hypothetical protein [Streptomyces marianii]|uniref:DUF2637 domain-containing protein n=1 Tax=Streptomyces marianii TaxID=1817406 RepID=A0A5R9DUK7_9ACTN|nr:hypothetical protein [Streptomyces marianii]TLQ38624.1 hypothetical protein FEF34_40825 [Streptomyces marianii]
MFNNSKSKQDHSRSWSLRSMVLVVLGAITVGVAVLSIAVSYQILMPRFGGWSAPTVAALDALWVVLQATEIHAANNRRRSKRVQWAGLALTLVIVAIPTADLVLTRTDGFDLALIITPVAITATKGAWWLTLPSLGRKVSPATRRAISVRRQEVADRLEQMEADAADRIELLRVATELERQIGEAETGYRLSTLEIQQAMVEQLHTQSVATAETVEQMPLTGAVAHIALPELDDWKPTAPALPVTPVAGRHTLGTQVGALTGARSVTSRGTAVTLPELAAVRGVPTPEPGRQLDDVQLGVVLRYLRYSDDPPRSYRQAVAAFRRSGFIGSEERVRRVWSAEVLTETTGAETDEETEDSDAV